MNNLKFELESKILIIKGMFKEKMLSESYFHSPDRKDRRVKIKFFFLNWQHIA